MFNVEYENNVIFYFAISAFMQLDKILNLH